MVEVFINKQLATTVASLGEAIDYINAPGTRKGLCVIQRTMDDKVVRLSRYNWAPDSVFFVEKVDGK